MLDPDAFYWIDAICINQNDSAEKTSQLPLMRHLYSRPRRTIVWLGLSTPELDRGMDFFLRLSRDRDWLADRHSRSMHGDRTLPSELADPEDWKALGHLFLRLWWGRVWTLQEFVLSREVRFFYGAERYSTDCDFHRAMYAQYLVGYGPVVSGSASWPPAWSRCRIQQWLQCQPDGMRLLALMAYTSDNSVTRPQDRICGMLGLASVQDGDIVGPLLTPSAYCKEQGHTVDMLYSRLVESFILKRKSLDIVCFAQPFANKIIMNGEGKRCDARSWALPDGTTKESNVLPLPSWVPDWRVWKESYVIPLMVSQGGSRHIGNFRPMKGRRKDHERTNASPDGSPTRGMQTSGLLDEVARTMVLGRRDRYLCDPPDMSLLCDQLKYLASSLGSTEFVEELDTDKPLPSVYKRFFQ